MHEARAVLFDLDETLIDAQAGLEAAHRAVAKALLRHMTRLRIKMSEMSILANLKALDDEMNLRTEYDRDAWWPILLGELGLPSRPSRSLVGELTRRYWGAYEVAAKPYADARSTLAHLKRCGYKLALVTDTDGIPGAKRKRAKRLELVGFFNAVVIGGEDTANTKPDPESFLLAADKLRVSPGECVVVGDKPFTDVRGAKAAGMRAILVRRRDWRVKERPDAEVRSLSELKRFFPRRARRNLGSVPSA